MKRSLPTLSWSYLAGLVVSATLSGCCWETEGSGNIVTETHEIADHLRVDVCCGWHVTIAQSDKPEVRVTGDDNIVEEIVVEEDGDTLRLRYRDQNENYRPTQPIQVHIAMAPPEFVRASGGSSVNIEQLLGGDGGVEFSGGTTGCIGDAALQVMGITASGGSRLCSSVESASRVVVNASGGSQITLRGSSERLQADLSGGSRLSAFELDTDLVSVDASGGSQAYVSVSSRVSGDASGGSLVEVRGEARVDIGTSGGSRVERQ